jgi:predicted transcriptional regulator
MADTTTVKVQVSTRSRLNEIGAATRRTVDEVIRDALDALERERWQALRRTAADQAAALAGDEGDQGEARAIQADLAGLRAW